MASALPISNIIAEEVAAEQRMWRNSIISGRFLCLFFRLGEVQSPTFHEFRNLSNRDLTGSKLNLECTKNRRLAFEGVVLRTLQRIAGS
jgi:hypothetical protein